MRRLAAVLAVLGALFSAPALAVQPDEVLPDKALEARARALSAELRCMVCQNQSIDDSDADLARDVRLLLRERLVAGDSDADVINYLVARYGEFVLLKPRLSLHTVLLWAAPPLVLIGGGVLIFLFLRRRNAHAVPAAALSPEEEKRLKALLEQSPDA